MLGFGSTVSHSRKGREDQDEGVPTDYVKVWAHGFAQQEGKTKGKAYLVVLVAGEGGGVGRQRRPAQSSVGGGCAHAWGVGASSVLWA